MKSTNNMNITTTPEVLHSQALISIEAEQAIIGALFLDNSKFSGIIDKIDIYDFYDEKLRIIFSVIKKLYKANIAFDLVTVEQELQTILKDRNIVSYLAELMQNTPSATNIKYYADIVAEKSRARKALEFIKQAKIKLQRGQQTSEIISEININLSEIKNPDHPENKLVCYSIQDFLALNLKPRENIIAPWFPTQGLVMVYAPRGVGKTYFGLTLGYAIACGASCFKWEVPKPRGVLMLDGEMGATVMQERLAKIVAGFEKTPIAPFKFITRDLNPFKHFSLSDREGQSYIDEHLDDIELIIVDNISTLCPVKENDSESWMPIQAWALRMRAAGISVLFIHHAGKAGQQRGSSKKEDILDTVIALRRPANYLASEGAIFEMHFEKSRGFAGEEAQSVQLSLKEVNEQIIWHCESVEQTSYQKVITLTQEGLTPKEICEELDLNKSTVSRHLKTAKAEGLL